jgi:hypothetical protein
MLFLMDEKPVVEPVNSQPIEPIKTKRNVWQLLFSSRNRILGTIAVILMVTAIPLTVMESQKQQEIRQRASSCGTIGALDCNSCKAYESCVPSTLGPMYPNNPNPIPRYDCCNTGTGTNPGVQCPSGQSWPHNACDATGKCVSIQSCGKSDCTACQESTQPPPAVDPGTPETIKSCYDCTGKYCGITWTVTKNADGTFPSCDTPPPPGAQPNQVVCSCDKETTPGTCGDTSKCGISSGDRCTRCSDVYKYCSVTFDKNPDGTCGNGDSAKNKVYTLNCEECLYGKDYGTCGGKSTSTCAGQGGLKQCNSEIKCTGECHAKIGVCGTAEKSSCTYTKLSTNPEESCTPVAVPNQPCSDINCPTGTCNKTTGQCSDSIKMCHDCTGSSTKYCGTTWSVPANELCTTPKGNNIQYNQPVCSCTGGTAGSCGGVSASQLESSCNPTSGTRCTRCSDVYKFCEVTYDKTNGVCGSGDSGTNKVYTLACDKCLFGTDYGSCGGISTASCKTDKCGNGTCDTGEGETYQSCPKDCKCGDGVCDTAKGENSTNCPTDCCASGTSKEPYKCVGTTCSKQTSTTCTANSCNPSDPNACKTQPPSCTLPKTNPHFECQNQKCVSVSTCAQNSGGCTSAGGSCGATSTPYPTSSGNTILTFDIGLDGIGAAGDHPLPCTSLSTCASNKDPKTTARTVDVTVLDQNKNDKTPNVKTTLTYASASGTFKGSVNVNLAAGNYTIKLKSAGMLKKTLVNIQPVIVGNNQIASANLTNGDIDGDNELTVLDYNILISCSIYSQDSKATCNEDSSFEKISDLTDNGTTDEIDYNLFLREYSVQLGD